MRFNIKNIVSPSCEWYVKSAANELGLEIEKIHMGELILAAPPTLEQLEHFNNRLQLMGLELIQGGKNVVVEKIKAVMHEIMVHQHRDPVKLNLSELLAEKLGYN